MASSTHLERRFLVVFDLLEVVCIWLGDCLGVGPACLGSELVAPPTRAANTVDIGGFEFKWRQLLVLRQRPGFGIREWLMNFNEFTMRQEHESTGLFSVQNQFTI